MKKLFLLISFVISLVFCYGQVGPPQVPRSGGSVTATDSNLFIGNSFRVPIFNDTTQANNRRPSLDSSGKVIFTRDINWFWGRQTTPSRKWIPFVNSSTNINTNCGNAIGTHIVTWDSLSTFDVTSGPYVLCCDGIPRFTNFTTVTLPPNDTSINPRIDIIILDSNGVNFREGVPSPNPAAPSLNDCEILLTYVLFNSGENVPANVIQNVIYDENYITEWTLDTSANITIDTADLASPAHLLHDIYINQYATTGGLFDFRTSNIVNLNDFGVLKFYVKKTAGVSLRFNITWYLDDQPQTLPLFVQTNPATIVNTYEVFVIALNSFRFFNTPQVNRIRFELSSNVPNVPFYKDWIQLQGGIPSATNVSQFTFSAVGNNVDTPRVSSPNQNPILFIDHKNQISPRIFLTTGNVPMQPFFGQLDLSQSDYFQNTLNPIFITPSDNEGDILFTENNGGNLITTWDSPGTDTTFVMNWLRRNSIDTSFNDTLVFGSRFRDSAVLFFNTFTGLNSLTWTITDTTNDLLQFNSSGIKSFDGVLPTSGSGGTDSALFRNSSTGQWYLAPSGGSSSETLQQVFNTEVGGSVLTKVDSIQAGSFSINIYGTAVPLQVYATGSTAVYGQTDNAFGVYGAATNGGIGINANVQGSGGSGVFSIAGDGNEPIVGRIDNNSTNTVETVYDVYANSVGTAAAGLGGSVDFNIVSDNGSKRLSNQLISKWTDATDATRTSQFSITGVNSAVTGSILSIDGDGVVQFFNGTTGGNTVIFGSNSPATAAMAPYTWFKMKAPDGTVVYIPGWK